MLANTEFIKSFVLFLLGGLIFIFFKPAPSPNVNIILLTLGTNNKPTSGLKAPSTKPENIIDFVSDSTDIPALNKKTTLSIISLFFVNLFNMCNPASSTVEYFAACSHG